MLCGCVSRCPEDQRSQFSQEPELQTVVSHMVRRLGLKLGSSARAVRALNHKDFVIFTLCVWMLVWMYVYAIYIYAVPREARRGS